MRRLRILLAVTVSAVIPASVFAGDNARTASPEEVVRAYVDAANRHDVEALLALYATDVKKYRFPGTLASEGRERNRPAYIKNFADNPGLKVDVLSLVSLGDKVVSRDRVTGLAGGKTSEEIAVYQITDGHISNIVYVERQLH